MIKILIFSLLNKTCNIHTHSILTKTKENKKAALITTEDNKELKRRVRIENKTLTVKQILITSALHLIEIYIQRTTAIISILKNITFILSTKQQHKQY